MNCSTWPIISILALIICSRIYDPNGNIFKRFGITTSFDTGWDPANQWYRENVLELLEVTDLFIPSEEELLSILNVDHLDKVNSKLPEKRGLVAIKRGQKGSMLVKQDCSILCVEAFRIKPIDTTGVGDSFNAGLISGFLSNLEGEELLELANACGALATLRIGGAGSVPSLEEVRHFQNSFVKQSNGLIK